MSTALTVTLHILDKEYRVSCPSEERLSTRLRMVEQTLDSQQKHINDLVGRLDQALARHQN